jgi:hypothetical protein
MLPFCRIWRVLCGRRGCWGRRDLDGVEGRDEGTLEEGEEIVEFAVGLVSGKLLEQEEVGGLANELVFIPVEDDDVVEVAIEVGQILRVKQWIP